jgi:hypothetical protein
MSKSEGNAARIPTFQDISGSGSREISIFYRGADQAMA